MESERHRFHEGSRREAWMRWTQIVEGGDSAANELIQRLGPVEALVAVRQERGLTAAERRSLPRWRQRLCGTHPLNMAALADRGIHLLCPDDEHWPIGLASLGAQIPIALWVRGSVNALSHRSNIALVGSRSATPAGLHIARDFSYELAADFTVISGGAFGIDAQVHQGAVLAEKPTVVVFAGGVDEYYPRANAQIFNEVLACGGAIVSESAPGAKPYRFRFLARNRIIAALSAATVVVEAPIRSGALSTARHAMRIGREVGAVPGPIDQPGCVGSNELIRHGAHLVASVAHIREMVAPIGQCLDGVDLFELAEDDEVTVEQRRVFDALSIRRSRPAQVIATHSGMSLRQTIGALGALALRGCVEERDGQWIRITLHL
ncbi:DNA-processing protein DprA [Trueperella sp. LYQ143]|uniref:DNA-processing protein DprA n=1 Tax=unclassified Trueperella TaxID=2630174 RepID=UPI0039834B3E